MNTTLSSLLNSFSQISAQSQCDNCLAILDDVRWKQCKICNNFDLCHTCAKPGVKLEDATYDYHHKWHEHCGHPDPKFEKDMDWVLVGDVETKGRQILDKMQEVDYKNIMEKGVIENDYDMSVVVATLAKMNPQEKQLLSESEEKERSELGKMLVDYHIQAYQRKIRVLSLDGGGVRGYLSIKVLWQLIKDKYLPDLEPPDPKDKEYEKKNQEYHENFKKGQDQFTYPFDYFIGTSTGGLIALCLATGYHLLEIMKLYSYPKEYFTKYTLNKLPMIGLVGDIMWAKYNSKTIHEKIDKVIGEIFKDRLDDDGKLLTAENATLLDLHNLLNPDHVIKNAAIERNRQYYGNLLEFVDDKPSMTDDPRRHHVPREKVLLITAYNTTTSCITVFDTSYAEHWPYRIADVLKATMAAPTYFEPFPIREKKINGNFVEMNEPEVYIDGGVFANDPELTALWVIRMQWKKLVNYRLLSIGTGCYTPQLDPKSWGGYYAWLVSGKSGLVIDTLMDATRSLTETIMKNLAKFDNIKRMKFNYKLTQSLNLDDPEFPKKFDTEWDTLVDELGDELRDKLNDGSKDVSSDGLRYGLRYGSDYKALAYFYKAYIEDGKKPSGMEQN